MCHTRCISLHSTPQIQKLHLRCLNLNLNKRINSWVGYSIAGVKLDSPNQAPMGIPGTLNFLQFQLKFDLQIGVEYLTLGNKVSKHLHSTVLSKTSSSITLLLITQFIATSFWVRNDFHTFRLVWKRKFISVHFNIIFIRYFFGNRNQ